MANTIKIKRGLSSNISNITLAQGELAITTDTNELYVGTANGNVKINDSNIDEIISIGETEPTNPSVQLWIEDDILNNIGTEVVDSLEGNETNKAPSVKAVKEKLSGISTTMPKFPFLYYYQSYSTTEFAEYGMTYQDWVDSIYNENNKYSIQNNHLFYQSQELHYDDKNGGYPANTYIKNTDVISPGAVITYCCFEAGSKVLITLDGATKNIEDLKEGDPVVIYNEDDNKFEMATVKRLIIKHNVVDQAKIIFGDGNIVIMNAYHPLLTTEGYHSITNFEGLPTLLKDDILITINGPEKIQQIIRTEIAPTTMYNLSIASKYHNFIVNSIVAHNATPDPCGDYSDHD